MSSHRPRHPRRRRDGRHTSLVGGPEYGLAPADGTPGAGDPGPGGQDAWDPAYGGTRTSLVGGGYDAGPPGGYDAPPGGYGDAPPGGYGDAPPGGYGDGAPPGGGGPGVPRTSLVGGYAGEARPEGERYVAGDWPRVWHGEYRPAGHPEDTVVLGDFGLFDNLRSAGRGTQPGGAFGRLGESGRAGEPGGASSFGASSFGGASEFGLVGEGVSASLAAEEAGGEPPGRSWYQRPRRLAVAAGGLALVAFAGFLVVPAILSHLGVGGTAPNSALCPTCQFPIPSSSPAPPTPAAPTTSAPRPRHSRAPAAATQPAAPAQNHAPTAAPPQMGTGLAVYYSETAQGDGGFLARVTVVNHDPAAVSGWQLVVALPYDNVSQVTNAQGYDEDDVLFLQPASSEPSIPPGGTLVVTIAASGPTTSPDDCSFDNVACQ
jgi:Cellulose binding domain